MGRLFGTDGVRGIANRELTCDLAYKIGRGATFLMGEKAGNQPTLLVAKDTRISGDMLSSALIAGILSAGGNAISAGILPTPAVAYLVRKYQADAGVMISASHNPMEYNGIKFFSSDGFKLPDSWEDAIEASLSAEPPLPTGEEIGRILSETKAQKDYADYLKSTVDCDFKDLKIALDCANGATSHLAESILSELGASVFPIANTPNGTNINQNCGSTHPSLICEHTVSSGADVGIAFDGDGDRVLFSDKFGNLVDGDQIMAILASHMKNLGTLKENTLVGTVMSNLGLSIFGKENGITVTQAKVGDKYVLEKMLKYGYNLGGEQSGHIILLDYNTTGDGILTALQILRIMKNTHSSLSQLASLIRKLPQVLVNATVKNENKDLVLNDEEISELLENINIRLFQKGRVLVRASGTEPLFRVMLEGENLAEITDYANRIAALIQTKYA